MDSNPSHPQCPATAAPLLLILPQHPGTWHLIRGGRGGWGSGMSPKMTQGLGKWKIWMKKALTASHACMLSYLSHVQLCDPTDCSLPGSSVHGILRARILEWVAMSSSRGSPWPRDQTQISYVSSTGRQFFTTRATREVPDCIPGSIISFPLQTQA